MEKEDITSKNLKTSPSKITWVELNKGEYIPLSNYKDNIVLNDQQELNDAHDPKNFKILSQNISNKKNPWKPTKIAFHKELGYVRLLKACNDEKTIWEGELHPKKEGGEIQIEVNVNDLVRKIAVQVVHHTDNQQSCSVHILGASTKIEQIVRIISTLDQIQCQVIFQGKEVELDKSVADLGITENDWILIIGKAASLEGVSSTIKFFKRFQSQIAQNNSWNVGRNKWDAIIVIPSRNVNIFGIGIYENNPVANFTIGWKYILESADGAELLVSEVFEEQVEVAGVQEKIIQHKFKSVNKGIQVKAGQRFHICMWLDCSNCCFSESGENYRDIDNQDRGLFEFKDSTHSSNSTRVGRGIIPGILYNY